MGGMIHEANYLKALTNFCSSLLLTRLEYRDLRSLGILPALLSLVPKYQQMAMPRKQIGASDVHPEHTMLFFCFNPLQSSI